MSLKSPQSPQSLTIESVICATVCGLAGLSLYASASSMGTNELLGYVLGFTGVVLLAGTVVYTAIRTIDYLISIGVSAFIDSITKHLK
jgi:hypothetical protein